MTTRTLFKILLLILVLSFPVSTKADTANSLPPGSTPAFNAATKANPYVYKFLAPMPELFGDTIDVRNGLGAYLDKLYTAGIAIATGLAVIMIVFGGIEYVGSGTIGGKSDGKQRIQDALIGLLLAFMSYLLLNTINPDLLKNDLTLDGVTSSGGKLESQPLQKGSIVNVPNSSVPAVQPTQIQLPLPTGGGKELPVNPLLPPVEVPQPKVPVPVPQEDFPAPTNYETDSIL